MEILGLFCSKLLKFLLKQLLIKITEIHPFDFNRFWYVAQIPPRTEFHGRTRLFLPPKFLFDTSII